MASHQAEPIEPVNEPRGRISGTPSRRVALGAAGSGFIALLTACSHGDGRTDADGRARPATDLERLRHEAQSLTPKDYVATYEVGSRAKYPTIMAAVAAATGDQTRELGITGGGPPQAQSTPWRRRRVLVHEGTYPEGPLALPPHTDLIGATGNPADVTITASGKANVVGTGGRSVYLGAVTFRQTSESPIAHPLNDSGYSGDAGLGPLQVRTVIIDNCVMDSAGIGLDGKAAADLTPGPGTTLVFNKVSFLSPGQSQAINCVVGTGAGTNPTSVFFIDSHVQANYERHADPGIAGSGQGPSYPVGLVQASPGRADTVVWAGGTWDISKGTAKTPIGALLALGYDQKDTNKSKTTWYIIKPGAHAGARTSWIVPGTLTKTVLPGSIALPEGGISAQEAAFYGEKPPRREEALRAGRSTTTMAVTRGRVYWVALDLDGRAAFSQALQLGSPVKNVACGVTLDEAGRPMVDSNGQAMGSAVAGLGSRVPISGRWFYPGQGQVWLGIAFGEDCTVPAVPAENEKAYTASGYTTGDSMPAPSAITAVPPGHLVPVLALLSGLPASYPS